MENYENMVKELLKSHNLMKHVIMLDEIEEDIKEEEKISKLLFLVGSSIDYLENTGHEESVEYGGSLGTMRVINNLIKKLKEFEKNHI